LAWLGEPFGRGNISGGVSGHARLRQGPNSAKGQQFFHVGVSPDGEIS
jgi:hypothetical protein